MNKANLDKNIKKILLKWSEESTILEIKKPIDDIPEWSDYHKKTILVLDEMWYLLQDCYSKTSMTEFEWQALGDKILRTSMFLGCETMRRRLINYNRLINKMWSFLGPLKTLPDETWNQLNIYVDDLQNAMAVCFQM